MGLVIWSMIEKGEEIFRKNVGDLEMGIEIWTFVEDLFVEQIERHLVLLIVTVLKVIFESHLVVSNQYSMIFKDLLKEISIPQLPCWPLLDLFCQDHWEIRAFKLISKFLQS